MEQQVVLRAGESQMTCILDFPRLMPTGSLVKLRDSEDPDLWWTVNESFELPRSIPRGWNNNI